MNTITIHDITFECIIGDLDWERTQEQPLRCDATLTYDFAKVAQSDDLHDAIDYVAVTRAIIDHARAKKLHMLEALASDLATHLLKTFAPLAVDLTLHKAAHFPGAKSVSVRISRTRNE